MLWIKEVEMVDSMEKSSRSVSGKNFPNFEMLDAKIASALNKIIQNSQFQKKTQKEDRFLRGRHRLHDLRLLSSDWRSWYRSWSIHNHSSQWRCSGLRCKMGWSSTIHVKDSLRWYLGKSVRIRESAQLKTVLELSDMEIHQKISMSNDQKLKTMVKRSLDQKLRLRNFDARHRRIGTGAVVKNWKGMNGVEEGKGTCYQWK